MYKRQERDRERDRQTQTDRHRDRQTQRQTSRHRENNSDVVVTSVGRLYPGYCTRRSILT